MAQQVLVSDTSLIEQIGVFQGYTPDVEKYISAIFSANHNRFVDRDGAEHDPRLKQLIPYVILRYRGSVFNYVRGKLSGESRLVARRSIGLGGHIEPADLQTPLFSSDRDLYLKCAEREVNEEIQLSAPFRSLIIGLINDDSNDVGRVHLGIVHIWDLEEPAVQKREAVITQCRFSEIEELRATGDELETWSQIALDLLADPKTPPYQSP
jgi:predicted NUDIX family phosphoesterase